MKIAPKTAPLSGSERVPPCKPGAPNTTAISAQGVAIWLFRLCRHDFCAYLPTAALAPSHLPMLVPISRLRLF